jgi:type 1 glutamine amidotransferase
VWQRRDEWYGLRAPLDASINVLLRLDEASYDPGDSAMGSEHAIAWAHQYDGGRAFYTALGHTKDSYADPVFLEHLEAAIGWAGAF